MTPSESASASFAPKLLHRYPQLAALITAAMRYGWLLSSEGHNGEYSMDGEREFTEWNVEDFLRSYKGELP